LYVHEFGFRSISYLNRHGRHPGEGSDEAELNEETHCLKIFRFIGGHAPAIQREGRLRERGDRGANVSLSADGRGRVGEGPKTSTATSSGPLSNKLIFLISTFFKIFLRLGFLQ
jgi:hypothetical protein